ncbi:O-antigen ligase family protein [Alkalihalobacillus sp. R86527]|uniref:O-antigen ligase family protein n=1 Tax=Alkalihalobacillus sp. R86527 TaxID=3093863 RepID=UPI00366A753C
METKSNTRSFFLLMLGILLSISSIVYIEPSPYDLLLIVLVVCSFFAHYLRFHSKILLPLLLVGLFVSCNLISMFTAMDLRYSLNYFLITCYLVVGWIFFIGVINYYQFKAVHVVFNGYLIAALLAVALGLLAFFGLIPGEELFLKYGRITSLFKDPNVYGPFLVPCALFVLMKSEKENTIKRNFYILLFLIISIGILMSFSRAAYGNFLIALSLFLILPGDTSLKNRMKTISILLFLFVPVIVFYILTSDINDFLVQRFGFQAYDSERFSTQALAIHNGLLKPLGIGPGQSELLLEYDPHSLFVRVLIENGWIGFLCMVSFLGITLLKSIYNNFSEKGTARAFSALVTAVLVGLIFNSFFIDTLHWRHLWLITALPWMTTTVVKVGVEETIERRFRHENRISDHSLG